MKHELYVYANSGAEERLLYLFEKCNVKNYKVELAATVERDEVRLYCFDDVAYKAIKQYLQNEES